MRLVLIILIFVGCAKTEDRGPNVAGGFYPGETPKLKEMLNLLFTDIPKTHISNQPILLIEPHAGYIYSGRVAAFGYQLLKPEEFKTVIIMGPSHRYYFYGASVDTLAGHKTPLGVVPYDRSVIKKLLKSGIKYVPLAHNREHSIEVELPFLQHKLKRFKSVEIVIGDYDLKYLKELADKLYKVIKNKKVLIVASSDLSHYHRYKEAVRIDQRTAEHIADFDPDGLFKDLKSGRCEACGGAPIITGLYLARELGANQVKLLFYANSGDATGDSSRVVGYLSAVAYQKEKIKVGMPLGLTANDKKTLRKIASDAINAVVRNQKFTMPQISDRLKEKGGAFVTIKEHGNLRGCIGFILAVKPLYEAVIEAAQSAATQDPRFPPLRPDELNKIEIEVSALTAPVLVKDIKEIKIGRDGLIIKRGPYQGLLLPQVATENDWNLKEFLAHTCLKAGLPTDAWQKEGTILYRFTAEVF